MSDADVQASVPLRTRALVAASRAVGLALGGIRRLRGRPPSILVARRVRLGDLVVVLPMLRALRRRHPDAKIVLGVQQGSPAGELLRGSRDVDAVRVIEPTPGGSRLEVLRHVVRCLADGYDVMIAGERFSLIDASFFSGARLRIGLDDGAPLQRLHHVRLPVDRSRHAVDNHLALAERLGAAVREDAAPEIDHLPHCPGRLAEELDSRAFLLLHCGAQKPSRRWPVERFAELARRVLDAHPKWKVAVTGVADESELVDRLRACLPEALRARCVSLVGRTGLHDLVSLVDCARVVVSNDTGVMHLAAARRAPLVALLGPASDAYWGPRAAEPGSTIALHPMVPCMPCTRWDCAEHYCLRSLEVDAVAAAVEDLARMRRTEGGVQRRHLSWDDLAKAGFELPRVVLPTGSARARRVHRLAAARLRRVDVAAEGGGIASPAYPRVAPETDDRCATGPAGAGRDADLVAVGLRSGEDPPAALGHAVAALQRDPRLEAARLPESGVTLARRGPLARAIAAVEREASAPAPGRPSPRLAQLVRDVWSYRELLQQITLRDIRIRYKQAAMGFGWALLMPMLIVGAGALVRYAMAQLSGGEVARSAILGITVKALPWAFFVGAIGFATVSLSGNLQLVTKVAFPRVVLPLSSVLTQAFDTFIGAVALALVTPFFGLAFSPTWAWVPMLAAMAVLLTTAASIFLACANLFFRDVKYLVQMFLTFGIFFTPVFFEPEMFGRLGSIAIMLNPLSPVLEGLRLSVVEGHDLSQSLYVLDAEGRGLLAWTPWYLVYATVVSLAGLAGSALLFRRLEPVFAEYA